MKFISKCFKEFREVLLSKCTGSDLDTKSKEPSCKVKVAIFITGLSKTSYTFTGDKYIYSVRIGKPITLINGNDDSKGGSFTNCSSLELFGKNKMFAKKAYVWKKFLCLQTSLIKVKY